MAAQDMLVAVMVDSPKHLAAGFGLVSITGKLNFKVSSCRSIGDFGQDTPADSSRC
jgi:hypothetical protein